MKERATISMVGLNEQIAGILGSADECAGVRMHAVRLSTPDSEGCNWAVQTMRASSEGVDCHNVLLDALNNLKRFWNLEPDE